MEQSYTALSLRKDRIAFACVFLFCLCIPKYIYVCLCICVFPNMTVFTTGSQQSACQNCFSCAQSSVSVNQDLTSGPVLSHNYVSLLHAPPLQLQWDPGTKALNTCFFMYWLCCHRWNYGPTEFTPLKSGCGIAIVTILVVHFIIISCTMCVTNLLTHFWINVFLFLFMALYILVLSLNWEKTIKNTSKCRHL